jgi:hypothetical protein
MLEIRSPHTGYTLDIWAMWEYWSGSRILKYVTYSRNISSFVKAFL